MRISKQFILYKLIKHLVPSEGFNVMFNDMKLLEANEASLMISENQVSEYRDLETGQRKENIALVTVNVTGDDTRSSNMKLSSWLDTMIEILLGKHNMIYYVVDGINADGEEDCTIYDTEQVNSYYIFIRQVDNLSGPIPLGKDKMDFPRYSSNLKIYYNVGGRE